MDVLVAPRADQNKKRARARKAAATRAAPGPSQHNGSTNEDPAGDLPGEITVVPTKLNWLNNRLVSTASATYGRIGLGFLEARLILLLARRPGISAATIAATIRVDAAAVSRTLKALKARKVITETNPARRIGLTQEGLRLCGEVQLLSEERGRRLLQGLSPEQVNQMLACLDQMLANAPHVAALADEIPGTAADAGEP